MILDIFTFNGELDMLEIRLNILYPYVDKFVIIEADRTFSGNLKPFYYEENQFQFSKWKDKIKYVKNNGVYFDDEYELAENSPNTIGAAHWKTEFLQKEFIKRALESFRPSDICFVGDVDEIWDPSFLSYAIRPHPAKLKLKVYAYWLNYRSNEQFWGTLRANNEFIQNHCLNHERTNTRHRTITEWGWHFTSMGGLEEVRRKLNDSYTTQSYNTYEVQKNLSKRLKNGEDYLGRDFKFEISEVEWPEWLKENKEKYIHLLKHE